MKIFEVVDKLIDFDQRAMSDTFEYFLDQESAEPFNKRIHAMIILPKHPRWDEFFYPRHSK